jgi:hypothetical protein
MVRIGGNDPELAANDPELAGNSATRGWFGA